MITSMILLHKIFYTGRITTYVFICISHVFPFLCKSYDFQKCVGNLHHFAMIYLLFPFLHIGRSLTVELDSLSRLT